jgi:hypothetical protein
VLKMKEGERALVTIAPQYAFGEQVLYHAWTSADHPAVPSCCAAFLLPLCVSGSAAWCLAAKVGIQARGQAGTHTEGLAVWKRHQASPFSYLCLFPLSTARCRAPSRHWRRCRRTALWSTMSLSAALSRCA